MNIRSAILHIWVCGLAGLVSGCAALLIGSGVAMGAGTVAYVRGDLQATEEVSLDGAWAAARTAVQELGFKVTETAKDALTGKIIARGADDKRITILLKRESAAITEIRIRVGLFGNESVSRIILDKIKKHL